MQFKEPRYQSEYAQLETKNPKLYALVKLLDSYTQLNFGKEIVLTCVFRTPEENAALYAQTPNPPATSPHMFWRAVDLRSSVFTDQEIQKLLALANSFTYQGGQRPVAIYHVIAGNSYHLHFQFGESGV